ncbi:hypothetical protein LEP1GSC047_3966 [Leptospira inadai serovar Lyme str. 10]|uniref:Uncharacterized protein n=2 Tax=Leptospira inadai serovar Lyme TaxID=293084 RepID=V6HME4_9LEPT|nr:hypothetical protein [Leptospira inadai]EQA38065.1 hypothetical protein LEP1GSC047_3966 [Leptospira inadai serovar Lyme str. 10]
MTEMIEFGPGIVLGFADALMDQQFLNLLSVSLVIVGCGLFLTLRKKPKTDKEIKTEINSMLERKRKARR